MKTRNSKAKRFCKCIKQVAASVKPRTKGQSKESAAIAICVSTMLKRRGRTLKKFSCKAPGGPFLKTQTRA